MCYIQETVVEMCSCCFKLDIILMTLDHYKIVFRQNVYNPATSKQNTDK